MAPSAEEFEIFKRQMKVRLNEGQGEAMYEVGIGGEYSYFTTLVYIYIPLLSKY